MKIMYKNENKILEELLVDKGVKKSRFRKDNKNQYGFIGIRLIG